MALSKKGSIMARPEQLQELMDSQDSGPVVMVNLLKFKKAATAPVRFFFFFFFFFFLLSCLVALILTDLFRHDV